MSPAGTTFDDAFHNADVVIGLSKPGSFSIENIMLMADDPIIFTLANPTPEIFPENTRTCQNHQYGDESSRIHGTCSTRTR